MEKKIHDFVNNYPVELKMDFDCLSFHKYFFKSMAVEMKKDYLCALN
jgi:hypothetical protein